MPRAAALLRVGHGLEIDGENEEYAFDLNEFFETRTGRFVHEESVSKVLDALTLQSKFPFSTDGSRNELKHTFWLLNRVDSAKALAKKLEEQGLYTMGDIARCSLGKPEDYYNEELLYQMFGVNAELLIDHAWGWEPCTIADIKAYKRSPAR